MRTAFAILKSLRPRQWIKNTLVFAGLIFARRLGDPEASVRVLALFGAFCLAAGGLYLLNDVADRADDRLDPRRRHRPVAAGELAVRTALFSGLICAALGIIAALLLRPLAGLLVLTYAALSLLYSLWLKRVAVLDVLLVVSGYVLRAAAGAAAIAVCISPWLLICTGLLALFMVLGKRRAELARAERAGIPLRRPLRFYSRRLLNAAMLAGGAATLAAYCAYTLYPSTVAQFNTHLLVLTIPLPLAGVVRYVALVRLSEQCGGDPIEFVTRDWLLLLDVAAWVAAVCWLIYAAAGGG